MSIEVVIETLARWRSLFEENYASYKSAQPFPFIVIDNFLNEGEAHLAAASFPDYNEKTWTNYIHVNEKKYGLNKREQIPDPINQIIQTLSSSTFIEALVSLTGIPGLIADDQLTGAGLHQMRKEGFLNIHSDFLIHPLKTHLMRRINLILFLSADWKEEFGGELEFWNKEMTACVQQIQPVFNRCVIFTTDEYSYHGCPTPLKCPSDVSRKSLALYYYTEYAAMPRKYATHYKARPQDKHKKLRIYLDNKVIAGYTWLKQRIGFSDQFASRILRWIKLK